MASIELEMLITEETYKTLDDFPSLNIDTSCKLRGTDIKNKINSNNRNTKENSNG